MNIFFLIDIFMNFFTASYTVDFQIVDSQKEIAILYFKTWFMVDFISIIPFDLILLYGGVNQISRFSRIGKLYKIVRMMKMIRLLKIAKVRNKIVKDLSHVLRIGVGFERLIFMMLIFCLLVHVIACMWIFIGTFDETSKDNWIYLKGIVDYDDYEMYFTSVYFTVTTIVTVGYGDIVASSVGEKITAVLLMITGVISFSFATGALSSIIASIDSTEAKVKERMGTLSEIRQDYSIKGDLFNKLARYIRYDHSKKQRDVIKFMEELPHKLKIELGTAIHTKMYSAVAFFQGKEHSFLGWISTVVR